METEQNILERLDRIERKVIEISEHMVDVDTILTEEERKLLDESIINEKDDKLVSLEEVEHVRNKT